MAIMPPCQSFSASEKSIWDLITGRKPLSKLNHLVVIPSGELFRLPLHIAITPEDVSPESQLPLAASVPLSFSVSATTFLSRGRHLLKQQTFKSDDDLCALVKTDEDATGRELSNLKWPSEHFFIAGQVPENVCSHSYLGNADRHSLVKLSQEKPEIFVYSGHGQYGQAFAELGPALELDGDCLTQFDIAMGVQLPRNKLTLLGACVSGQGADGDGGEVAGFLRAFIAAGCGALGVTLWPVLNEEIESTMNHLLTQILNSVDALEEPLDIVQELYNYYANACKKEGKAITNKVETCPLIIYL